MPVDRWATWANRHRTAVVVAAYSLLTALMTYPQVVRLADGTRDWGDPLLTTWIIWWEVESVVGGNLAGFFDANMFFPHLRTLAYSEFLIPQAIAAAPLILLFDNPLIAHNLVLLASFVATAMAMYALGKHLTGSAFAGFVSGLAMAFSPFMLGHLSHVQVIGAAGIPLAFYFLHRYFEERAVRYLLAFSAVYVAQSLGNAYYALYLTYAAGAFIAYRALRDRLLTKPPFWAHMGIHAIISAAVLGPFFAQYVILRRELGFVREMAFDGGWYSFLAAPPINRLYGDLTEPFHASEAALFPGLGVVALAVVGITVSRARPAVVERPLAVVWPYRVLGALIVVEWLAIIAITLTGGITTSVAGMALSINGFENPLLGLAVAIGARVLLRRLFPGVGRRGSWLPDPQRFYACMLFAVVLLSLGPDGLYGLLYAIAPGFDGIRAVPRIHVLTVFCLAVFVAYGTRAAVERLSRLNLRWVAAALPLVILVEFFSAPVPMFDVRWGEDAPGVYRWLAAQEGDFAVVEYPIDPDLEFERLFYSTVHAKKLVNGTSGYESPTYQEMRRRMWEFPSPQGIEDLHALGIRWVVVHPDRYLEYWPEFAPRFDDHAADLELVAEVDGARVYEVRGGVWLTREELNAERLDLSSVSIPREGWTVAASINSDIAGLAIDGDLSSRWNTDLQRPGAFYQVDFGGEVEFDRILIHLHDHPHDYPRGYRIEVSNDGVDWRTVAADAEVNITVREIVDRRVGITLPATRARHLRIVQTASSSENWWTIHELEVRRQIDGER